VLWRSSRALHAGRPSQGQLQGGQGAGAEGRLPTPAGQAKVCSKDGTLGAVVIFASNAYAGTPERINKIVQNPRINKVSS